MKWFKLINGEKYNLDHVERVVEHPGQIELFFASGLHRVISGADLAPLQEILNG